MCSHYRIGKKDQYISQILTFRQPFSCWRGNIPWELVQCHSDPDSEVHGANMGPTWVLYCRAGTCVCVCVWGGGGVINIKMSSYQCSHSHCKDKIIVLSLQWELSYPEWSLDIAMGPSSLFSKRMYALSCLEYKLPRCREMVKEIQMHFKFQKARQDLITETNRYVHPFERVSFDHHLSTLSAYCD